MPQPNCGSPPSTFAPTDDTTLDSSTQSFIATSDALSTAETSAEPTEESSVADSTYATTDGMSTNLMSTDASTEMGSTEASTEMGSTDVTTEIGSTVIIGSTQCPTGTRHGGIYNIIVHSCLLILLKFFLLWVLPYLYLRFIW